MYFDKIVVEYKHATHRVETGQAATLNSKDEQ